MKKLQLSQNAQDWLWAALAAIALVLMVFFYTPRTHAQNVVLQKNVFVQQSSKGDSTKTDYEYQARDGKKYTIYLSQNGKAFIVKWSEKKQKWYRQYLPKITEMLKEADNGRSSH